MTKIRDAELYNRLKAYILDLIVTSGGGSGPYAPSPHDLSSAHHSGSLADSQAPQFLKTDGSRQLIGNLAVAEGITIDGVDLSGFKQSYDLHAATAAADAHAGVGLHTHQSNAQGGQLDHGLALIGLLDDDHTQYAHAEGGGTRRAYEAGRLNKSVIAGAGLTGGGLLTTNQTLSVLLNASWSGLSVDSNGLRVNTAAAFVWTNNHVFQGLTKTRHLQPELTDTYDLGTSTLLWRKGWLSELDAILFAQNTVTLLGGWLLITKDEGAIDADVAPENTQVNFGKTMTVGDFVLFRAAGKVEYMQVGSLVSGTTYNVTRNLDGSGADAWPAGTPYAVLGQSGQGRIELNAYDTPRIQLIQQGATYNAQTEIIRIGDLNGNWGYTAKKWGVAIGEYASGKSNITIDQDGVLRIRNFATDIIKLSGTDATLENVLKIAGTSSAIAIGNLPPTSSTAGTGLWIDRTGLYGLNANVRQVWIDATNGRLYFGNGQGYLNSSGIIFAGVNDYGVQGIFWNNSTRLNGYRKSDGSNSGIRMYCNASLYPSITIAAYTQYEPTFALGDSTVILFAGTGTTNSYIELNSNQINISTPTLSYSGNLIARRDSSNYTGYIYVPKTGGMGRNLNWDGDSKATGTYTLYASDFGMPNTAVALAVKISARWTTANDAYTARLCDALNNSYAVSRAIAANIFHDSFGIVPLSSGQFRVIIVGANASAIWVEVAGYYI